VLKILILPLNSLPQYVKLLSLHFVLLEKNSNRQQNWGGGNCPLPHATGLVSKVSKQGRLSETTHPLHNHKEVG